MLIRNCVDHESDTDILRQSAPEQLDVPARLYDLEGARRWRLLEHSCTTHYFALGRLLQGYLFVAQPQ